MSMLEDYWLPRREGGKGTEIDTLSGGENLGQIEDVVFFQKKLYRALNVPVSRLQEDDSYTFGRASEISRDEVKFQRFIDRLRKQFAGIILDSLRAQLILKGIIERKEWPEMAEKINIDFNNLYVPHFSRNLFKSRGNLLARPAPLGPTVDQDGRVGI